MSKPGLRHSKQELKRAVVGAVIVIVAQYLGIEKHKQALYVYIYKEA